MEGFGTLFIFFGIATFIVGLLFYHGHFSKEIFWTARWKNITKAQLKIVGRATMGVSISILLTGITALFFEKESITPFLVLIFSLTLIIFILCKSKIKY